MSKQLQTLEIIQAEIFSLCGAPLGESLYYTKDAKYLFKGIKLIGTYVQEKAFLVFLLLFCGF
jgi:hypothetical protein